MELHSFCDASENVYADVVYLRMTNFNGTVQVALVTSKTKVAPIKLLTIPGLKLCGTYLLAQLLHYLKQVFCLPLYNVYAWTDSTIVLHWLIGNPKHFKPMLVTECYNHGPHCTSSMESCQRSWQSYWLCLSRPFLIQASTSQVMVEWSRMA